MWADSPLNYCSFSKYIDIMRDNTKHNLNISPFFFYNVVAIIIS